SARGRFFLGKPGLQIGLEFLLDRCGGHGVPDRRWLAGAFVWFRRVHRRPSLPATSGTTPRSGPESRGQTGFPTGRTPPLLPASIQRRPEDEPAVFASPPWAG